MQIIVIQVVLGFEEDFSWGSRGKYIKLTEEFRE